jgi:3-dehydroquinate synthase
MIIPVKTTVGSYDVVLEKGSLNRLGELLKLDRKVLIVTDDGVPESYSKTAANQCKEPFIVTLPQGEPTKSIDNYLYLLKVLVENSFTRSDCVLAVGGGVMGDLAGFVASTFMRGVDFYNVPTTVLSQVDSSIGGKVAVDFSGYKNIVGAFYPPKRVVIDVDTLKTLPKRQISNGLCESVKIAMTFDKDLFALFEKGDFDIETVIEKSLKIKRDVVEKDEKESGLRKVLNFGHTIAHGIESENNMQNLYHGECVGLGMLPVCSIGVRERLIKVLESLNLPTKYSFDTNKVFAAVAHDKKLDGENLTVIYVEEIGSFVMKQMTVAKFKEEFERVNS